MTLITVRGVLINTEQLVSGGWAHPDLQCLLTSVDFLTVWLTSGDQGESNGGTHFWKS